jgi:hypothetical protein
VACADDPPPPHPTNGDAPSAMITALRIRSTVDVSVVEVSTVEVSISPFSVPAGADIFDPFSQLEKYF